MRYPASEKLEIIRVVEGSHLPAKQILDKLGIPKTTFYRWYDRYLVAGADGLEDQAPMPSIVWNRIPDNIRDKLIELALACPELSPRELAVARPTLFTSHVCSRIMAPAISLANWRNTSRPTR